MGKLQSQEIDNEHGWLFDPGGVFLVGVVGVGGLFLLSRHGWVLGIVCEILATLGLVASHRHFDPAKEGENI